MIKEHQAKQAVRKEEQGEDTYVMFIKYNSDLFLFIIDFHFKTKHRTQT